MADMHIEAENIKLLTKENMHMLLPYSEGQVVTVAGVIPIEPTPAPTKVIYLDGFDGPFIPGRIINDAPIGITIEDSRPVNESDGKVFDDFPDGHIVEVMRSGVISFPASGSAPNNNAAYVTDAQQALDTLPRVIRKLIYRYAKWRLR